MNDFTAERQTIQAADLGALAADVLAATWPNGDRIDRLSRQTANLIADHLIAAGWTR